MDHAGARRLPHAPGVRRRSRARVRTAPAGRDVRGDRAGRRRHPVHRARHARGGRRRPVRRNRCRARRRCCAMAWRRWRSSPVTASTSTASASMLRVARRIGDALGITVRTTYLAAHALPPEFAGTPDAYVDAAVRMAAAAACRRAGRCGGRVLRRHRLLAGAGAARVRSGARARRAGEVARRPAERPRRRGAGGGIRRPVRGPCRTHDGGRRARDGGRTAPSRCCCRAPSTSCATRKLPPLDAFRAHGVPMAVATDCNPGTSPLLSVAPGDATGLHAFPADARRSACAAPPCTRRARSACTTAACCAPACAPTSCAGASGIPPNCATGSAANSSRPSMSAAPRIASI